MKCNCLPVLRNDLECKYIHYNDVIMSEIAPQITSLTIVYSSVYSGADQRKLQSSVSLAFARGNSPVTGEFPAQRASNPEMFTFDDYIMFLIFCRNISMKWRLSSVTLNWLDHSAWIQRLGVRFPFRSRHFLSQNLWHFHKNIRSCGENECWCSRTVNISNVNFTSKISIPPEPVFKNMGQQMSGPDSSNG